MKILYVTTVASTFNFLYSHIKMLREEGHKVDIATSNVEILDKKLINEKCKIFNVNFNRSPFKRSNLKAINDIKMLIKNEKYDIVHTHTPIASFITRLACKNNKNIKVIYTAHGFHFYKGAPIKNWLFYYPLEKLASKWTNTIITINEEDFKFASRYFNKHAKVYKVNGVGISFKKFENIEDKNTLKKRYNLDESFILFYAAELNTNKNQNLLIDTIYKVKNTIPNVKLLLAGKGPLESTYKEKVRDLNLEKHIFFLGFRNDIPELLKVSDIVIASSQREGLPVNILEAMVNKLPIIATDNRGHRSLIDNNNNGYLVENDSSQMADKLLYLYNHPDQRKKLALNGYNTAGLYKEELVLRQLKEVYKSL